MSTLEELVNEIKTKEAAPALASGPLPAPAAGSDPKIDAILGSPTTAAPVSAGVGTSTAKIDGEALIALLDGMTPVVVRLASMRYKIHFTAELTRECRLTEPEKAQLRLTADAAAPLVAELLQKSKNISVGIFALSYAMIVANKLSYVRQFAAPPQKENPSEPEIAPSAPSEAADGGDPASKKRVYNRSGKFRGVAQARRNKAGVTSTGTGNGVS